MKTDMLWYLLPYFIVAAVLALMWPGVSGPFLLDDFLHFPKLAWLSDGDMGFWRFVFSDGHGSGRPMAFLSLLIEDSAWPTLPFGYKVNNVLFHGLNTLLVFWIALELFKIALPKLSANSRLCAAALVAIWWGIHPIQLSPVMLTIQRMTLLMATFVFLGLLAYLKARAVLVAKPKLAWFTLLVVIPLCALLSLLFKEPGALLPCFILIIELSIRDKVSVNTYWQRFVLFVGIMPLVLLAAYYFYMLPKMDSLYATRDFNMVERLLTQQRVLFDYVRMIAIPSMRELGPYQDYYAVSRGLMQPMTTLLAMVGWAVLLLLAVFDKFRSKTYSWLFFAVFWFLVGHILESSFVPIELYFEHRNYVPMIGIIVAIVALVFSAPPRYYRVAIIAVVTYLFCLGFITYQSAKTWGSEPALALNWSNEHPDSARAQFSAMRYHLIQGELGAADVVVNRYLNGHPDAAGFHLLKIIFGACYLDERPERAEFELHLEKIGSAQFDRGSHAALALLQDLYDRKMCSIEFDGMKAILDAYLSNPKFDAVDSTKAHLYMQLATLYKSELNFNGMMMSIDRAYEASPQFMYLITKSVYLADAGIFYPALCSLMDAENGVDPNKFSYFFKSKYINKQKKYVKDAALANGFELDSNVDCSAI